MCGFVRVVGTAVLLGTIVPLVCVRLKKAAEFVPAVVVLYTYPALTAGDLLLFKNAVKAVKAV